MGCCMRWTKSLLFGVVVALSACTDEPVSDLPQIYVGFPSSIDPQCRAGSAKMFDECGDQLELFNAALARANAEGKVLLVEIGAEWCIWCHVFDAHINGDRGRFRYTYGAPEEPDVRDSRTFTEPAGPAMDAADALREFVATHFVVAHIDIQHAPRSDEVLELSGAVDRFRDAVPFVYVVDSRGIFVSEFDHDAVEKRRDTGDWYRGYDRIGLLEQLKAMHEVAAAANRPAASET